MGAISAAVLSGKGGTGKSLWQMLLAGEASRLGIPTLLVDVDPERNMSNRFRVPVHSTGLGNVLEDAGVTSGEGDPEKAAKRAAAEILQTPWDGVDLLPAGASLTGVSQVSIENAWLLRDIFEAARLYERYGLLLLDTGGRVGSLVTLAMYASDVAYAPIGPSSDAVRKALEARARVDRIQRAHPLRWAGVLITGFDLRRGADDEIRAVVLDTFGDEVRAEVPRRAAVNESFELLERLGDRRDVAASALAEVFRGFLERDLMGRPGHPDGVLR